MGGKKQPSKKAKRQINEGLRRWNEAKSYIARRNKQAGKKFNGVEVNAMTKGFLAEHWGTSFDNRDLEHFLAKEVREFEDNIFQIPFSDLTPTPFYMIDSKIRTTMPKNITIVVNGGPFGTSTFNSSNYDYYSSGTKDIVEGIRDHLYPDEATPSLPDAEGTFDGYVKRVQGAAQDSKDPKDYFVEWLLYVEGDFVTEVGDFIIPIGHETREFTPKQRHKQKIKNLPQKVKKKIKARKEELKEGRKFRQEKWEATQKHYENLEKENKDLKSEISDLKAGQATMLKMMADMQKQLEALSKKSAPKKKTTPRKKK